jgi:glycosyltransferase involved in cell wall biosynthesis
VATQTYANIEVVIVEQGGATAAPLAAQLRAAYSLSVHHLAVPPLGRSAAANEGLAVAQGDYLMFLDDDAMLFSDHVEILVNGLLNEPQRDAAYSLPMEIKTVRDGNSRCPYYEVEYVSPERLRQPFDRPELLNRNFIRIQSVLFRRSLYQRYGGLDESLGDSADWDLWLRYSYRNDFLFIEKTTSLFRSPYRPGREQRGKGSDDRCEEAIRLKHHTPGFSQRP